VAWGATLNLCESSQYGCVPKWVEARGRWQRLLLAHQLRHGFHLTLGFGACGCTYQYVVTANANNRENTGKDGMGMHERTQ
jgi:hypothetical protein